MRRKTLYLSVVRLITLNYNCHIRLHNNTSNLLFFSGHTNTCNLLSVSGRAHDVRSKSGSVTYPKTVLCACLSNVSSGVFWRSDPQHPDRFVRQPLPCFGAQIVFSPFARFGDPMPVILFTNYRKSCLLHLMFAPNYIIL